MNLPLVALTGVIATTLTISLGTVPAHASGELLADTSSGIQLPLEGAISMPRSDQPLDVVLPDGEIVRLPSGSEVTRMDGDVFGVLPTGETLLVPEPDAAGSSRVASGYYPPVRVTHSRSQVETVYRAVNNISNVCRFVPLPYLAAIGCGASPTIREAYSKAHYQAKRVRVDFYRSKVCSSCSYTKYTVIK